MVPYSKDEKGWWEKTTEDEPERADEDTTPKNKAKPTHATEAATTGETRTEGVTINPILGISSGGLLLGLFSPWSWYDSGFQALSWAFSDLSWALTDGLSLWFSEWGLGPLGYITMLMDMLLPLVFVTTFVATWYKSLRGDEEFGRKAGFFHLSFFVVLWIISSWHFGHVWLPSEQNYGTWIAAASGIGLHRSSAYGLVEKFSNSY